MPAPPKITSPSSLFPLAYKPQISGGQWNAITGKKVLQSNVTNVYEAGDRAMQILVQGVATNAFHNSAGRLDPPKCYPGTREEVMSKIFTWIQGDKDRKRWLYWLSGPAGAGKSAIVQSVAEGCIERKLPMASFFFFRADSTRNIVRPLVATIAYQMISVYPALKDVVTSVIEKNPLLFGQSIAEQFDQLIVRPLRKMLTPMENSNPFTILIDGLDECDSDAKTEQITVIRVLQEIIQKGDPPFIVLIASRPEAHITMAFNRINRLALESLFLDESYQPSSDIRRFVQSRFGEIASTHHLAHTLSPGWPPTGVVEDIVAKSSGQFIYAATVIRFIASSPMSPAHSLDIIQGLRFTPNLTPFSALDAIYSYILSRATNLDAVKDILTTQFFRNKNQPMVRLGILLDSFGHSLQDVESYLSDLLAIARFDPPTEAVVFYHASLEDYLVNSSRSGEYHVDLDAFPTKMAVATLSTPSSIPDLPQRFQLLNNLMQTVKTPSADLAKALSPLSPMFLRHSKALGFIVSVPELITLLSRIAIIYAAVDVGTYKSLLRIWLKWSIENDGIHISLIGSDYRLHDIPYALQVWDELSRFRSPPQGTLSHIPWTSQLQDSSTCSSRLGADDSSSTYGEPKSPQESPSKRRKWWTMKVRKS